MKVRQIDGEFATEFFEELDRVIPFHAEVSTQSGRQLQLFQLHARSFRNQSKDTTLKLVDHDLQALCTLASSSTNFCLRSDWSWPLSASAICVMFMEQNFGPHMEQNLASL